MPGGEVIGFGFELAKSVGAVLGHRTKRLYLYGGGRVGKTTFANLINNSRLRFNETREFSVTPGAEKSPYTLASEINPKWRDYTIEMYGFGGQGRKREQRWAHFNIVNPDGVIFIASPCIATDEDQPDQFLSEAEMFEVNDAALDDLIELLSSERQFEADLRCKYVLPAISFRDIWESHNKDYEAIFQRRYHDKLAELGKVGIQVANRWYGYTARERASMLPLVETCLENTRYVTNWEGGVEKVMRVLEVSLGQMENITDKAAQAASGLNANPNASDPADDVKPFAASPNLRTRQSRSLIGSVIWRIMAIIGAMITTFFHLLLWIFRQASSLIRRLIGKPA